MSDQTVAQTSDADFLRGLLEAGKFGEENRERLQAIADGFGLKVTNPQCRDCWRDLAVQCLATIKKAEAASEAASASSGKWSVRPGLDVYFGSVRVNATTLTDELAERLLAKGFPKHLLILNKGGQDDEVGDK